MIKVKTFTNKAFLKSLVCPISRTSLKFNEETKELISEAAALAFPIRNGIPVLLIDEARKID